MLLAQRDLEEVATGSGEGAMPYNVISYAARFTYGFDNRYFAEINMGYNGSEQFAPDTRFGFFPAFSGGWVVTNENFLKGNKVLTNLKLRASYGKVGSDQLGGSRFLYMDNNTYSAGSGIVSGYGSISEGRIGNKDLHWEVSRKQNYGVDVQLFSSWSLTFDYFIEKRSDILKTRGLNPYFAGIITWPTMNLGKTDNRGFELELNFNKQVTKEQTTSLEITPEKMEIDVGENQFIETNLKDVTFKSDDHNIATVSDSGRVKGIKNGTTTITVTAGNQKKTCQVTVKSSQAVITAINASSTLMQENYDYSANNLIDQNNSTAWSDGIDGDGIGETLTFVFEQESSINEINILNGYCKSEDLYYKNSRIKKVTLIFDDGEEQIDIEDIYNQSQSFKLANQHQSKQMVLRIDEVYTGNKYSDTCVSEISVK